MFPKPISVEAIAKYKIRLKYSDGTEGEIDLSYLNGSGIFIDWEKRDVFFNVYIDKETDAIAWNKKIELCPDSLYLKLIGKSFQEYRQENLHYAANK